jgi:hypothetical protein
MEVSRIWVIANVLGVEIVSRYNGATALLMSAAGWLVVSAARMVVYVLKGHEFSRAVSGIK